MTTIQAFFERAFWHMVVAFATVFMALMTAGVSFLWDMSKSVNTLNQQVSVVIEQVTLQKVFIQNNSQRLEAIETRLRLSRIK